MAKHWPVKQNVASISKPEIFTCPLFREFCDLGKFAKITSREYGGRDDLLCFYGTVIRPVLEYACPVWHSSLCHADERNGVAAVQSAANHLWRWWLYHIADQSRAWHAGVRREQLTERCFKCSVLPALSAPGQAPIILWNELMRTGSYF